MTVPEQVAHSLQTHRPLPYCDSCIKSALKLKRHQQVQQATSGGAASGGFIRRAGTCSVCGKTLPSHTPKILFIWSLLHSHTGHMPVQRRGEAVGNLWADPSCPLDRLLRFRNDVVRRACCFLQAEDGIRYCERCPPTAATWNGCGFPDANCRWGDNLPGGKRFYTDRRPDTRTSRTWRTGR